MSGLMEALLTTDDNGSQWTCCLWDPHNGSSTMTYRGGGAANSHGLCILRDSFIISADATKPLLHIWPVNKQDQVSGARFVIPGKASALSVSNDGNYLIAGVQETIYVWNTSSGKMLNSLMKHYQCVSALKFTDDDSHFVSAGQDGVVIVWNLTRVVSEKDSSQQMLYTFKDHALPVTDIHIGKGNIRATLCTVSIDRTCKIYDLASGTMLVNLVFGEALLSVTMNILETTVYVGSASGSIYEFSIQSPPRTKEYHMKPEDNRNKFSGHESGVTCLSLSLDGETMVSGGKDNKVILWHRKSKQILRTILHKGAISNLFFIPGNENFLSPEKKMTPIAPTLKRMIEPQNDDDVIEVICTEKPFYDDEIQTTHHKLVSPKEDSSCNQANADEIEILKEENARLKKANKNMLQYFANNLLNR